ncbi:uncharacterized protein LOC115881002 [Sitophilus oryzae]|uniref:Uncharacterized protein LOC115881002 n=1 Tax=Sitophilus oryzae TaxID=7048 RepID=A0A6J2XRY1_SITOR|nr:uncharacterized protein LOC115881002 [Sitophilus oryzae]
MRFGRPATVITDNGTQYTGRPFRQLLKDFGVNHRLTPPYTPQANPVERANKTTKTMIAQFCEDNHKKWDAHLSEMTFAFNTSRNDWTGFSSAFLNFGRELESPKTLLREEQPSVPSENPEPTNADITSTENRLNRLKETFELVRLNLSRAFASQSHYYNVRRREWQYMPRKSSEKLPKGARPTGPLFLMKEEARKSKEKQEARREKIRSLAEAFNKAPTRSDNPSTSGAKVIILSDIQVRPPGPYLPATPPPPPTSQTLSVTRPEITDKIAATTGSWDATLLEEVRSLRPPGVPGNVKIRIRVRTSTGRRIWLTIPKNE